MGLSGICFKNFESIRVQQSLSDHGDAKPPHNVWDIEQTYYDAVYHPVVYMQDS